MHLVHPISNLEFDITVHHTDSPHYEFLLVLESLLLRGGRFNQGVEEGRYIAHHDDTLGFLEDAEEGFKHVVKVLSGAEVLECVEHDLAALIRDPADVR